MKRQSRILSAFLALLMMVSLLPAAMAYGEIETSVAGEGDYDYESVVLFTQDIHDHFLPVPDGQGGSYGGFARLSTRLKERREIYPDAVTVDAGDFSMGSLFQTIYATRAPELRLMGQLGFDATVFGNHEFDFRARGLIDMLNTAADSGETLPALVNCNYYPPREGEEGYTEEDGELWQALEHYGVQEYVTISRGGITYAIFGLFGQNAHDYAPLSPMIYEDSVTSAQETVDAIRSEVETDEPLFIICISHCGTGSDTDFEDERVAEEVEGLDLLVSGHSHTVMEEPVLYGDTLLVSGGSYTRYLGEIVVRWNEDGSKHSYDYRLLPLGDDVAEDPAISRQVRAYQTMVEQDYLSMFGFEGYDQVLVDNEIHFDSGSRHQEYPMGNLIADSYRYAVEQAEGEDYVPVDFALTASGVIRGTIPTGQVTVSDVFNVSSLGIGDDGVSGYPLIEVYLTGADLKNAFEVDASVTALMSAAQLHFTGMRFSWNPYRMIFNKVIDCAQVLPDGSEVEIEDEKLYRVVTGLYCGQMLGTVQEKSFGILSITPRDENGQPIDMNDLESRILHDKNGAELKEWAALASYLESFEEGIPDTYAEALGRKVEEKSLNPVSLFRNMSRLTFGIICLVLAILLLVIFGISRLIRFIRKRRRPDLRDRSAGERYSGSRRRSGRYGKKNLFGSHIPSYRGRK
ncbi:MAG: bifunctional metallophosphatase/5'-nucleotidase [Oscillospiraceae bacterium]|nr:bifunctional metallophosphatase/5'-nucleotidase [Oscillospiraceae bacterium]